MPQVGAMVTAWANCVIVGQALRLPPEMPPYVPQMPLRIKFARLVPRCKLKPWPLRLQDVPGIAPRSPPRS